MAECYRHPGVQTRVSCSSCGRAICPDCMTPTSVGMRCPECSNQKTKVRTAATLRAAAEPRITYGLIGACVILYIVGAGNSRLDAELALFGPFIAEQHEYWRLITGGFLHAGTLHILFNMYMLWIIGRELEPILGSERFGALYGVALLWGAAGALAQTTTAPIVGASGAVFGIVGALMVEMRRRDINPLAGGLGMVVAINLVIGFMPGLNIAWGGHIGGLIGGALCMLAFGYAADRRQPLLGWAAAGSLAAAAFVAALVFSGGQPHNFGLGV